MESYWWIEKSNGKLVGLGRKRDDLSTNDEIWECGCVNLQFRQKNAQRLCRFGEHPVKVNIVKVKG